MDWRKIDWISTGIGAGVLLLAILVFEIRPAEVSDVEERIFDRYQIWSPRTYDPNAPVRVVDIDQASLEDLGQWPWPRTYLAELVRRLTEAGAAAIAFDMVFAEPDRTSPRVLSTTLARFGGDYAGLLPDRRGKKNLAALPDHDEVLAKILAQTPVVLGMIPGDEETGRLPPVKAGISVSGAGGRITPLLQYFPGATTNLPLLSESAAGIGAISLARDEGEVIRRVPLVMAVGDRVLPALSVDTLRVAQRSGSYIVKTTRASGETDLSAQPAITSMRVGALVAPLDADGTLRVRYSGEVAARVIPAHRVLAGDALPPAIAEAVAGRIVLVGASAAGLFDTRTTPLTPRVPGVHIHAEIIEQMIEQDFLTRPDWAAGLERLYMILIGLAIIALLSLNLPILAFLVMLGGVAASAGGSWWWFQEHAVLLSPLGPAVAAALPHFAVAGYKYFTAEQLRREITRQFEHFVSPDVIEEIIEDPEHHLTPGGSQRELSIMFLDVRQFSTITERMEPQQVIQFINKLLTPLTDAIIEHEGTVDKYMGDAVMAFWNAPRVTERHAEKAVRAMLAFTPALERVNGEFRTVGLPPVEIGVGINTGDCSVGNMGSSRRLAYSCVGDAVNLASRLEGQTKQYGVRNMIGSATAEQAASFALIEVDRVAVKGRTQPERVFTVAGDDSLAEDPGFRDLAAQLESARAAYLRQDWDAAEAAFRRAAEGGATGEFDPAPLAEVFLARITEYRETPPPADWDGVYVATAK